MRPNAVNMNREWHNRGHKRWSVKDTLRPPGENDSELNSDPVASLQQNPRINHLLHLGVVFRVLGWASKRPCAKSTPSWAHLSPPSYSKILTFGCVQLAASKYRGRAWGERLPRSGVGGRTERLERAKFRGSGYHHCDRNSPVHQGLS